MSEKKQNELSQEEIEAKQLEEENAREEFALLKDRAKLMGIKFPNNITAEKLQEKVSAQLEKPAENSPKIIEKSVERQIKDNARKLVRIRLTSHDDKDREAEGVLIDISNDLVHFKKFIQFDVPWHVPNMIYKHLRDKKIQKFKTKRVKNEMGIPSVNKEKFMVDKYAIEVLPPLTQKQVSKLSVEQKAEHRI